MHGIVYRRREKRPLPLWCLHLTDKKKNIVLLTVSAVWDRYLLFFLELNQFLHVYPTSLHLHNIIHDQSLIKLLQNILSAPQLLWRFEQFFYREN